MKATREAHERWLFREHQRVLALSVMHGAIRRLEENLQQECRQVPVLIRTIDSLALAIVNRWRGSLGRQRPVTPTSDGISFEGPFHSHIPFDRICEQAAELVSSPTVGKLLALTYPIVVVDEFQDCHGSKLELVKQLDRYCELFAAADDFQLLEDRIAGCPAVGWISEKKEAGAEVTLLTKAHRCTVTSIVKAAEALRFGAASRNETIPIYCCPTMIMAAVKLINHRTAGSVALISPTNRAIGILLKAHDERRTAKGLPPITWRRDASQQEQTTLLMKELALKPGINRDWIVPKGELSQMGKSAAQFITKVSRIRGLSSISTSYAFSLAARFMSSRSFSHYRAGKRTALTVHGAKNREFDNVVVIWDPHSVKGWTEDMRRRLLYNAVTRARKTCAVLYFGTEQSCRSDTVLRLLGSAKPAFAGSQERKQGNRTGSQSSFRGCSKVETVTGVLYHSTVKQRTWSTR